MEYLTKNLTERGHSSLNIQTLALRCARCVSLQFERNRVFFFLNSNSELSEMYCGHTESFLLTWSQRGFRRRSSCSAVPVQLAIRFCFHLSEIKDVDHDALWLHSTLVALFFPACCVSSRCVAVQRIFFSFSCTDTLHFRDVKKKTHGTAPRCAWLKVERRNSLCLKTVCGDHAVIFAAHRQHERPLAAAHPAAARATSPTA